MFPVFLALASIVSVYSLSGDMIDKVSRYHCHIIVMSINNRLCIVLFLLLLASTKLMLTLNLRKSPPLTRACNQTTSSPPKLPLSLSLSNFHFHISSLHIICQTLFIIPQHIFFFSQHIPIPQSLTPTPFLMASVLVTCYTNPKLRASPFQPQTCYLNTSFWRAWQRGSNTKGNGVVPSFKCSTCNSMVYSGFSSIKDNGSSCCSLSSLGGDRCSDG